MASRWWHQHDDRTGPPTSSAHETGSLGYRQQQQQPAVQQYMQLQQYAQPQSAAGSGMRAEAEPFKPQGPAPGFNKAANPTAPKSALAKVWEYEDPLKDVHGPFDAAQIINWFAQDWFGTDLKIRRIGQYWTQLEYVLEELKAEARGTAMPAHGGYSSAPQQIAQAATTPVTSFANGAARTANYGGAAPAAAALTPEWAGNQQDVSSVPEDSWAGSAAQVEYSNDAWSGAPASSASASRAPAASGYRSGKQGGRAGEYGTYGAADYGGRDNDYGGSGWEPGSGPRSRTGGRAGGPTRVQLGVDGKWERGHVIDGDSSSRRGPGRGGSRAAGGYQDYDAYGDDYGSTGRERRGRRGGGGYGGDGHGAAGGGYERASKILEGEDDEEYGVKPARGRPVRAARGAAAHVNDHDSTPPAAAAASWGAARKGSKAEAADGRASGGSSNKNADKTGISEASVAAAVAAATAGIGAVGFGDVSVEAGDGWGSKVVAGDDGWGDAGASAADDDGWGMPSEPKAADTHQPDAAHAAPEAAAAAADPAPSSADPQQASVAGWVSSSTTEPAAGAGKLQVVTDNPAAASAAEEAETAKATAAAAGGHAADDSWGSADQSRRGSAQSPPTTADNTHQPTADMGEAAQEPDPLTELDTPAHAPAVAAGAVPDEASDRAVPPQKLSGVKALIAQQEEMAKQAQGQLTPPRGSTPTATPPRFATPPRSPEPEGSSQQSLVKSITDGMFGRLLGGDSDLGSEAQTASTNGSAGAGEGSCVSKLDADSPASEDN